MNTDKKIPTQRRGGNGEKPYGYEGKLKMDDGTIQEFHYVGSERRARLRAMLRSNADSIVFIEPVTKEQWHRVYGVPGIRM